jgi:hypothetical protein
MQQASNIPLSYLSVGLELLGVVADGAASVLSNFANAFLFAFSICVVSKNEIFDYFDEVRILQ